MLKPIKLLLRCIIALAMCGVGRAQGVAAAQPGTALGAQSTVGFAADPTAAEEVPPPTAVPAPASGMADGAADQILGSLPHPPALPASLSASITPSTMVPSGITFPYFTVDRLLDTPVRPPGWFFGGEADAIKPFLIPQLIVQDPAGRAAGTFFQSNIPSAPLNWTVSPRVFLGYRLPSGFGELSFAYRHLDSVGATTLPLLDGPTSINSRLRFDMFDFDYSSSEFVQSPDWEMKWFVGLRFLVLNYESQAQQPPGQAAGGSGILSEQIFNNSWGLGPHAGLELNRHLPDPRWSLTFRADTSSLFTFLTDGYQSTTITGFAPAYPNTKNTGHQETPILFMQAGLSWQPAPGSPARIFIGYQYEHMWALNFVPPTGNNPPSTGQVVTEGIVLRGTIRY